ncbi:MAG TPA: hypothetical protein VF188_08485 [Longimicrobiales bacterium]
MALTECPECRGMVSDRAVACPHCGFPFRPDWRELAAVAWRRGFRHAGLTTVGLPAMYMANVVVMGATAGAPVSAVLRAPFSGWLAVWAVIGAITGSLAIAVSALVRAVRGREAGWAAYWQGSRRAALAVVGGFVLLSWVAILSH